MTKHQISAEIFFVASFQKEKMPSFPLLLTKKKTDNKKLLADICCFVISFYFNEKNKYSKNFQNSWSPIYFENKFIALMLYWHSFDEDGLQDMVGNSMKEGLLYKRVIFPSNRYKYW